MQQFLVGNTTIQDNPKDSKVIIKIRKNKTNIMNYFMSSP
jgi:hypothetical protein